MQLQDCTHFRRPRTTFCRGGRPCPPVGHDRFAATYRKNGCVPCGESAASTPTNGVRIRIGASVFAGASCRADRVVRPYGCLPFRMGSCEFAILYRAGGVEPRPYGSFGNAVKTCEKTGGASPSPTLRRNVAAAQNVPPFSSSFACGDSFPSRGSRFLSYPSEKVTAANTAFFPSGLPTASRVRSAVCRR